MVLQCENNQLKDEHDYDTIIKRDIVLDNI